MIGVYQLEIELVILLLDSQICDLKIKSQVERVNINFLMDPSLTANWSHCALRLTQGNCMVQKKEKDKCVGSYSAQNPLKLIFHN